MLTITIDVNGKVIERMTAQRIQNLADDTRGLYDYSVTKDGVEMGFIEHKYADGALRLAELLCKKARFFLDK